MDLRPALLVGALLLGVASDGVRAAAPEPAREAKRRYDAGRLDEACPIFTRIAEERKTDGAAWADAGLCELKRRREAPGRADTLLALRYGDAAVRKAAAYNWGRHLAPEPLPERGCRALPARPELGCSDRAWACSAVFGFMGIGREPAMWWQERWVVVGRSGVEMRAGEAWLASVEVDEPGTQPATPAPAGMTAVVVESVVEDQPKSLHPEYRSERCEVLVVDPCGGRVFLGCASFDSPSEKKATGREVREVGW